MKAQYKAGDFTSGKMGEIFKKCFTDDVCVISHKQFGTMYLINEDPIRVLAIDLLTKSWGFDEYMNYNEYTLDGIMKMSEEDQFTLASCYFELDFNNWIEVIFHLSK